MFHIKTRFDKKNFCYFEFFRRNDNFILVNKFIRVTNKKLGEQEHCTNSNSR